MAALTISVAAAEEEPDYSLSFFSNGSTRDYTPPEMQFGAIVNSSNESGIISTSSASSNETERKHVYIQFYEDIATAEHRQILSNYSVELVLPTAGRGNYIASMPADMTAADIPVEAGLRWMGEIPPEDKYDYTFGLNVPEWAKRDNGQIEVYVSFYDDVSIQDAQQVVNKYSNVSPISSIEIENGPIDYQIIIDEQNFTLIATEDTVHSIGYSGLKNEPNEEGGSTASQQSPAFQSILSAFALVSALFCLKLRR
jgi:hypothetical protein